MPLLDEPAQGCLVCVSAQGALVPIKPLSTRDSAFKTCHNQATKSELALPLPCSKQVLEAEQPTQTLRGTQPKCELHEAKGREVRALLGTQHWARHTVCDWIFERSQPGHSGGARL